MNDLTWRFNLRRGVKFHDGTAFTADDVVFCFDRAQTAGSNFKVFAALLGKASRIDDFTVEIVTRARIRLSWPMCQSSAS